MSTAEKEQLANLTLKAKPNTDIWKKPPSTDVFTAPYRILSSGPLDTFYKTWCFFQAKYTEQYDQAGLLLIMTKGYEGSTTNPYQRKWIKTGIELYNSHPLISTVACDSWADWSVYPINGVTHTEKPADEQIQSGKMSMHIWIKREEDENGMSLWVYALDPATCKEVPLREITWVFGDDGGKGWELDVCALVARPAKDAEGELECFFESWGTEWTTDKRHQKRQKLN